ncbi:ABC-F family ATP-binding cassette domain-containing protein [Ornithinibacillus massiliensis]|uniref:ABC-F family ATP-binding cassette domain-containing protein n=1 Tax=Ornithinibacillus massiliensis TaxID=1944633 RepID=A0ABS5MEU0_9BACI|nr:ABC-F family ATP-binding cassette domain-containing protein [Ornithinibacillus massiliensis]MBS3680843.1 ABC-F family ATP-binding cassette domain-containing protein [Ornithinibacillus massiliensis]
MLELKVNGLKKFMEATLVLEDVTFEAFDWDRIGIVGVNGSGKSTILKIIAGLEPMNYYPGYPQTSSYGYDEGVIQIVPNNSTTAYLEQMPEYPKGLKVIDILNLAFEEIDAIEKQMRDLEEQMEALQGTALEKALNKYSNVVQVFELKGGYDRGEKLSKVCTGLKMDESFLNKEFDILSGGEKTTVILGKLLIHNPDILLLDEPTNHLDMESIEWLESYLKSYQGIVLIVSHDRYFLDHVATKIVEVEDKRSFSYKGNYSSFVSQKEENIRIQLEQYRQQQKKINAMESAVKDLRDWAIRADNNKFFRRAVSIQKRLEKMERLDKPSTDRKNMRLGFKEVERSGKETIKATKLSKCYGEKVIFKEAELMVHYGERVGLIGPNGSGKTTFLKMLLGEEQPDTGEIKLGASVKVAYLPQKITFEEENRMLIEVFRENISILEGKAREYLAKFMFYKSSVYKRVRHLSGGERIRLKLAILLYQEINLLILDEPTNHLDIDSIEALEEALEDFQGTIFFISHDRYFINKLSDRIIVVEDYALKSYLGNYDYYKQEKEKISNQGVSAPPSKQVVKRDRKPVKEKKAFDKEKLLVKIELLEREIKDIDTAMAADQIDYQHLQDLYNRKVELSEELNVATDLWLGSSD